MGHQKSLGNFCFRGFFAVLYLDLSSSTPQESECVRRDEQTMRRDVAHARVLNLRWVTKKALETFVSEAFLLSYNLI